MPHWCLPGYGDREELDGPDPSGLQIHPKPSFFMSVLWGSLRGFLLSRDGWMASQLVQPQDPVEFPPVHGWGGYYAPVPHGRWVVTRQSLHFSGQLQPVDPVRPPCWKPFSVYGGGPPGGMDGWAHHRALELLSNNLTMAFWACHRGSKRQRCPPPGGPSSPWRRNPLLDG